MQKPSVDDLWLEYRVANQYAKTWDRAEENVALIRRKELSDSLPTQADIEGLAPFTASASGSPAHWMQQVDVTVWFRRDELGLGSGHSVYDTIASLATENPRRRRRYASMLTDLAKARQVLSRTVHGGDKVKRAA